jgi:acetyl esterase/lipase
MAPTHLVLLLALAAAVRADEPLTLKLFPDAPPARPAPVSETSAKLMATYGKPSPGHVMDVADPTITIYKPEKPNGACVIVAPGGGYMFLTYISEGSQVCEWLNSIGVTGVLLKYRVPTRDEAQPFAMPVEDARKAISIVRERAAEWKVDPKRVGLLGFSAGGNLLGHAACDAGVRPDFGIMIYGGGFLDPKDPTKFREGFSVPVDAPPMFLAVAHDDKSNPVEATRLYLEYKRQNIPVELHVFTKGGHGFGMRQAGNPINNWPQRVADWMGSMGYLK